MGEKGMETQSPSRIGSAVTNESLARVAGVSDIAAAPSGGGLAGTMQQVAGGGLPGLATSNQAEEAGGLGQPPKG